MTTSGPAPGAQPHVEPPARRGAPARDLALGLTRRTWRVAVGTARTATAVARPVVGFSMRPPGVPADLQPARWVDALGRAGAGLRAEGASVARPLDRLVPATLDLVLDRLDLTAIVLQRVDLELVVTSALAQIDLVGIAEEVIDGVDLPEIIRESTGSMASETVRGARMQGISADEAVGRAVDRILQRRGRRSPGGTALARDAEAGSPAVTDPAP